MVRFKKKGQMMKQQIQRAAFKDFVYKIDAKVKHEDMEKLLNTRAAEGWMKSGELKCEKTDFDARTFIWMKPASIVKAPANILGSGGNNGGA